MNAPIAIAHAACGPHKLFPNFLFALIVIHLADVRTVWLLAGDNSVMPMLTESKRLAPEDEARERPSARDRRTVTLGILALAVTAGLPFFANHIANRATRNPTTCQQ